MPSSADDDDSTKIESNPKNMKNIPETFLSRRKIMSLSDLPKWSKKSKNLEKSENYENDQIEKKNTSKNLDSDDNNISGRMKRCNDESDKMKKNNKKEMDAYHRVLKSIFYRKNKNEFFPSVEEVALQWNIFDDILHFIDDNNNNNSTNDNNNNYNYNNNNDNNNNNNDNNNDNSKQGDRTDTVGHNNHNKDKNKKNNISLSQRQHIMLRTYSIGSSIESIMER